MVYSGNPSLSSPSASPDNMIQAALDAISAHIVMLDETGTIIGINAAWRRFADRNNFKSSDYGLGTNYLAVCDTSYGYSSEEAGLVAAGIRRVIQRLDNEYYLEYACHSPTEKRWFELRVTHFEWQGQMRLIVAHHNITDLKLVQNRLQDNQARLEAILNSVANGILTVNSAGNLESVNPAAAEMFGYTPDELTCQPLNLLFGEPHSQTGHRQLIQLLKQQPNAEWVGVQRDGTLFPMSFIMTELPGNHRWHVAIIQDLTDRKRMEAEMFENERISLALAKERELRDYKNRFISVMSHELRTPLSSILLSSDLLKMYADVAPKDERDLYIDNIQQQVEHMTTMVRDMLSLNRMESGELEFTPRRSDFMAFISQIVDEYRLTTQTHRFYLTRDGSDVITPQPLEMMFDPKLMRQVITNLISNGVKYSEAETSIRLDLAVSAERLVLCVRDEGYGIPAEDLPRLFHAFHRGGNVADVPGTGLGLSIVKQLVELHQGEITVESALQKGSTFTLTLPLVNESTIEQADDPVI